ncbi:fibronectin type III domain-containing protein [Wukongibacter baidiensis]
MSVTMKDPDKTPFDQWQRAKVYIEDQGGNKQAGTEVSIIWENGSEIISSSDTNKKGYAFIHKSSYTGVTLENVKLVVEASDYEDAACTQPTGTIVKQKTISKADLTEMNFHIDISAPVVNSFSTAALTQQEIKANIEIADVPVTGNKSGIPAKPYKYKILGKKLDSSWETVKDWDTGWVAGSLVNEENFSGLQANRQYEIEMQATDKVGNIYDSEGDGSFTNNIKYTYALSPSEVKVTAVGNSDITLNITTDSNNYEPPEYRLIAVPTDGSGNPVYNSPDVIVGSWSSDTNQTISGLKEETEYIVLVDTRNGEDLSFYTKAGAPTPTELQNIKNDIPVDSDLSKPIFTNRSPSLSGISANKSIVSSVSGHSLLGGSLENNTVITLSGDISDDDSGDKIKLYYAFDIDTFDGNMPTIGEELTSTGKGWTGNPLVSMNTIDMASLPTSKTVAPADQLDDTKLKDGVHTLRIWAVDHRGAICSAPTEITVNIDNTSPNILEAVNIDTTAVTRISHKINLPNAEDVLAGTIGYKVGIDDSAYRVSKQLASETYETVGDWFAFTETEYTIDSLTPNGPYKFKVEVRDKLSNISQTISDIKYTHALPPTNVSITAIKNTEITVDITEDTNNYQSPEYRLIAVPTDGSGNPVYNSPEVIVGSWSSDTNQTISGLKEETQYILLVDTRNGDNVSIYTGGNTPTPTELENIKKDIPSGSDLNNPVYTNRFPTMSGIASNKSIVSSASGYSLLGGSLENNTVITLSGNIGDDDSGDKIRLHYSFDLDTFDANMPTIGEELTSTGKDWSGNPFASMNTIDLASLPTSKTVAPADQLDGTKLKDGVHTLRIWAIDHRGAICSAPTMITVNIDNTSPNILDTVNIDTTAVTRVSHKINLPNAEDVLAGTVGYKEGIDDNAYRVSKQLASEAFESVSDWLAFTETEYTIGLLKPNGPYKFKVEVKDKLNNISQTLSDTKYTYALLPTGSSIVETNNTEITIGITPNEGNYQPPEYRLIAVPSDENGNPIFDSSDVVVGDWSLDTTQKISGLKEEKGYIILIDVKNGDGISEYTGDNSSTATTPTAGELSNLDNGNTSDITNSQTNTPVYTNRQPEIIEFSLSEGIHHQKKPLEVKLTTKELDVKDKLKVFYKIEGLPGYTLNQIQKPDLIEGGFNYEHVTPYREYTGYVDFNESVASGIYGLEVWLEDKGGKKSPSKTLTFKVGQDAYYLDGIKDIAKTGTDEELKEALKNILGSEFTELYYPVPIPSNITETKYLGFIRDEISKLTDPITTEDIKEALALVNINAKLSINKESTITEKEITLALLSNSDLYNSSYIEDYQKELRYMYDEVGGSDVMRLDYDDILFAVKFVNFKKMPIDSIMPEHIREIVGDDPSVYDEYIKDYRESIGELNNPTLQELEDAINMANINNRIEDGKLTVSDLKGLLKDTEITPSYLSEYIKYLQMYQNDLDRDLTKDEIDKVVKSVNAVIEYEENKSSSNQTEADNSIDALKDGDTKEELSSRIEELEDPTITEAEMGVAYDISGDKDLATIESLNELSTSSKRAYIEFIEGKSNSITVKYNGNKTILVRDGKTGIKVTNIDSANRYRFIEMTGFSQKSQDWQNIKDEKINETVSFNQGGYYSGGIQLGNKVGTTSEVTTLDFIVDWENPTGKIEKYVPMQSATKDDSVEIKLDIKDNLNTRKFAKINGSWDVMPTDYFDYKLSNSSGLKVIEIEVSDLCGNRATLKDTIWKVEE